MTKLIDRFGRKITYLRVSVTDRCNLQCVYCTDPIVIDYAGREEILTYEEIARFVRIGSEEGIQKIRLTGGEPTVRKDLPLLVRWIASLPDVRKVVMTTNGLLLRRLAEPLREAGLHGLNISLDTKKREVFLRLTMHDKLADVVEGIEEAARLGFSPLKINMVVMRGINDDEVADFALWTKETPIEVRFIEFMPIANHPLWKRENIVPMAEIISRIEAVEPLEAIENDKTFSGPAREFRFRNAAGQIGFITAVSNEFCPDCNRLRLTATGQLRGCLMSEGSLDLRGLMRGGASDDEIRVALHQAVWNKPEKHHINDEGGISSQFTMLQLGG